MEVERDSAAEVERALAGIASALEGVADRVVAASDPDEQERLWHLRHAARYSLWDEAATAEVAPASKIGFCLVDSEDIAGTTAGTYYGSCARDDPEAGSVSMGLSPGWRDYYPSTAAHYTEQF